MNPYASRTLLCATVGSLALTMSATGDIISPDGSLYTITDQTPPINSNYTADNLFDQILEIGDNPGDGDDEGRSWGTLSSDGANGTVGDGIGRSDVVVFELDQVYTIDALIYAQRQFNDDPDRDKNISVSIWASETTPFTIADPGTAADIVDLLLDVTDDTFLFYALPTEITGRYFRLQFEDSPTNMRFDEFGNPIPSADSTGGSELRFNNAPEPGSLALLGLGGLAVLRRRR
ncbi:MAG: PEP-CTERM sorting domain-containing protein [Phycisphaerales bacterium JB063]